MRISDWSSDVCSSDLSSSRKRKRLKRRMARSIAEWRPALRCSEIEPDEALGKTRPEGHTVDAAEPCRARRPPIAMTRSELFSEIEPYETGRLAVDDIHTLYWEQSGNPNGVHSCLLPGGPGSG